MKTHNNPETKQMRSILPKLFFFILFIICSLSTGFAQIQQINGTIVDKNGDGIIGASIIIKGSNVGTITDVNGKFSLKASPKDVLLASYIGYIKQSISVGTQKTLRIVLEENSKALDEVIVVGYGTQKKSDLTGSVVSVKADEMNAIPTTSVAEMLRGQAAGLVVSQNSDRPGGASDIVIRNSLNSHSQ